MSLLAHGPVRDLVREAEASGFAIIRSTGGHLHLRHRDGRRLVIPTGVNGYKGDRGRWLVLSIQRTIGGRPSRGQAIRRSVSAVGVLIALLLSLSPKAEADWPIFSPAVFLLATENMTTHAYDYLSTAFFVDDHGTAMTTTHSVRHVLDSPSYYRLIAILPDGTTRLAQVSCATHRLLDVERTGRGDIMGRDVAIIQVLDESPSGVASFKGDVVAKHSDEPLGVTPYLPFSQTTPSPRSLIRLVGYGYRDSTPHQYEEAGAIMSYSNDNPDHARIMTAQLSIGRAAHGDSGGPLLNAEGQVVGLFAWLRKDDSSVVYAVAVPDVRCQP